MKHGTYSISQRLFALMLSLLLLVGMVPPVEARAVQADFEIGSSGVRVSLESNIFSVVNGRVAMSNTWNIPKPVLQENETQEYTLYSYTLQNTNEGEVSVTHPGGFTTLSAGQSSAPFTSAITLTNATTAAQVGELINSALYGWLGGSTGSGNMFTVTAGTSQYLLGYTITISNTPWQINYGGEHAFPLNPADPKLELYTDKNESSKLTAGADGTYSVNYADYQTLYFYAGGNGGAYTINSSDADIAEVAAFNNYSGKQWHPVTIHDAGKVKFTAQNSGFAFPYYAGAASTLTLNITGKAITETNTITGSLYQDGEAVENNTVSYGTNGLTLGITDAATEAPLPRDCTYSFAVTASADLDDRNQPVSDVITLSGKESYTYDEVRAGGGPAVTINRSGKATVTVTKKAKGYQSVESSFTITVNRQTKPLFAAEGMTAYVSKAPFGSYNTTINLNEVLKDYADHTYTFAKGDEVLTPADGKLTIPLGAGIVTDAEQQVSVTREADAYYGLVTGTIRILAESIQGGTFDLDYNDSYTNKDVVVTGTNIMKNTGNVADLIDNSRYANVLTYTTAVDMAKQGENTEVVFHRDADGVVTSKQIILRYDSQNPEFALTADKPEAVDKHNTSYALGAAVTVKVTPKEDTSGIASVTFTADGSTLTPAAAADGSYSVTYDENNPVAGLVTVTVTDNAGNSGTDDISIFVDTKAPEGTLKIGGFSWKALFNGSWIYNLLTGRETVSVDVSDNFSSEDKLRQTLRYAVLEHQADAMTAAQMAQVASWSATAPTFAKDSNVAVYAKVTDEAGNTSYFGTNGLIVDMSNPTIQDTFRPDLDVTVQQEAEDIVITVTATDGVEKTNLSEIDYSGIDKIQVSIEGGNNLFFKGTQETVMTAVNEHRLPKNAQNAVEITTADDINKTRVQTAQFTIYPEPGYENNDVTVTMVAWDNAGHESAKKQVKINLDTLAPRVTLTHSDEKEGTLTYYKKGTSPTVTISVTDKNFLDDDTKNVVTVTRNQQTYLDAEWSAWANGEGYEKHKTWTPVEDGEYVITVSSADAAENTSSKITASFTLDRNDPKVNMNVSDYVGEMTHKDGGKYYLGQNVKVTVAPGDVTSGVAAVEYALVEKGSNAEPAYQSLNGTEVSVPENFFGTVYVRVTDKAGNSSVETEEVARDTEAPTGTLQLGGFSWKALFNGTWIYDLLTGQHTAAVVELEDNFSKTMTVQYIKEGTAAAAPKTAAELDRVTGWSKSVSVSVSDDENVIVYAKITDEALNTTYLSSRGLIVDNKMPTQSTTSDLNVDISAAQGKGNTVVVTVDARDGDKKAEKVSDITYSGIHSIAVSVDGFEVNGKLGGDTVANAKVTEVRNVDDIAWQMEKDFTITLPENCEKKDVVLTVTVTDNLGISESWQYQLNLDAYAPRITLEHAGEEGKKEFYKESNKPTVTVTIEDLNFDAENTKITVKRNDAEYSGAAWSGWTAEDMKNVTTWTPDEDGKYTITVSSTDKSGNAAQEASASFTYDTTDPLVNAGAISIVGEKTGIDGKTYTLGQSVDVDAVPSDETSGVATVRYSKDGTTFVEVEAVEGKYSVTYDKGNPVQGTVTVEVTDRSGNVNTQEIPVFVDNDRPTGEITVGRDLSWKTLFNGAWFYNLLTGSVSVSGEFADNFSAEPAVKYARVNNPKGPIDPEDANLVWEAKAEPVEEKESANVAFIAWVMDEAGNEDYISTHGLIVDNANPFEDSTTPEVNITAAQGKDGTVDVTVDARDAEKKAESLSQVNYSGIHSIAVSISDPTLTLDRTEVVLDEVTEVRSVEDIAWKMEEDFAITLPENYENDQVKLTVTVKDNMGLSVVEVYTMNLDNYLPRIKAEHASKTDGFYKDDNRPTVTLTVTDLNFVADKTPIDVTRNGEAVTDAAWSGWTAGENNTWTNEWKLEKDLDGDYAISFTSEDASGNKAEAVATSFILDTVDPDVSVAMDDAPTFEADGQLQFNLKDKSPRTATVTIKERNFDPAKVTITVTKNGEAVDIADYAGKWAPETPAADPSRTDEQTYNLQLTFREDADYTIDVSCTDLAGNEGKSETLNMAIDSTPPELVEIREDAMGTIWKEILTILTFGIWKNETITVEAEFNDVTTDVNKVFYYIDYSTEDTDVTEFKGKVDLEKVTWQEYSEQKGVELPKDQQAKYVVYFKAVDNVENDSYFWSDGIIIDTAKPEGAEDDAAPTIIINEDNKPATRENWGIYATSVPLDITVAEPMVNNSYSGLKSVKFTVENGGHVEGDQLVPSGTLYEFDGDSFEFEKLKKEFTLQNFVIDGDSNNVTLTIYAEDNAGNTNSASISLMIDHTAPKVTVDYDNDDVENDKYFNKDRIATITVDELNFRWEDLIIKLTGSNNLALNPVVPDANPHTATVAFTTDGDYTLNIDAVQDKAGNFMNIEDIRYVGPATNAFTIDKTPPKMEFQLTQNEGTGNYHRTTPIASVVIDEHNFDPNKGVVTNITVTTPEGNVHEVELLGWTHNGDTHIANFDTTINGVYRGTVDYTDLAGNAANTLTIPEFIVDTVEPEIEILFNGDPENKLNYSEALVTTVNVKDFNLDADLIDVVMTLRNLSGITTIKPSSVSMSPDGWTYTLVFDDPAAIRANDGLYNLSVSVKDKAGWVVSETRDFIVNRYGSVYYADDQDTLDLLTNGYTNKAPGLEIIEINPNALKEYEIDLSVSGNVFNLVEDTDFTVEQTFVKRDPQEPEKPVPSEGWYKYIYSIAPIAFMENDELRQGDYTVILSSEDESDNLNSSINYLIENEDQVKFDLVIDAEQPAVVIGGIVEGEVYETSEQNVQITVDDANLREVKITVVYNYGTDEERIAEEIMLGQDQLAELGSPLVLKDASDTQTVFVTAKDAAGNEFTTQVEDVTVSTNRWIVIIRSAWFAPTVASLGILFIILMYLLYKRNMKKRDAAPV